MIEYELQLPFSTAEVLDWFTEPDRLTRWLCQRARVELKVGGRYELFWEPERPGVNGTLGCEVLEYEPGRTLKFSWAGNEERFEFMEPGSTTVAVNVAPTRSGCRLRLEHYGFGDCDRWLKAECWFDITWKNALARLRKEIS